MRHHVVVLIALLSMACGGSSSDMPGGGDDDGVANGGKGPFFPAGSWFYEDVSGKAPAGNSAAIIQALRAAGGWGNGDRMQIDFSIEVLASDGAAKKTFKPTKDFGLPDCDPVGVPMPAGGNVEGETGYACTGNGDCHLIVFAPEENRLYEMWRANLSGGTFNGGCLAVWDTSKPAVPAGRGLQCTSADAAGYPIAPLLFTADEVAAGEIAHAIRFILPNDHIQRGFVPPATHGTDTSGGASAPYYGVHLRLRADYPLADLPNEGARTVARAMQKYGMYHADGGNIALTARSDQRTTHKWDGLLGPRDLAKLKVEDFEVIDHGAPIDLTFQCKRTPLSN
jgi:hypothetical protein